MDNKIKLKKRIQIVLLLTAVSFIVYGLYRGEVGVILKKAVNICFECIGLG